MQLNADGRFGDQIVTLTSVQASGPAGFSADAKGTVPLDDRQMAVDVDLNAFPLAALNSAVKDRS